MIIYLYITTVFLVTTKLCDVLSTLQNVAHYTGETNPIARGLMARFGTARAVWGIFLLSLLIIGLSAFAALNSGLFMQILFVFAGTLISVIQALVAHCNWSGYDNFVTRGVRNLHSGISSDRF